MEPTDHDPPSEALGEETNPQNMEKTCEDLRNQLKMAFKLLKGADDAKLRVLPTSSILERMNEIVQEAWKARNHGLDLVQIACDVIRSEGVMDFVLNNSHIEDIQLPCAKLLNSSLLTEENREFVVNSCLKQAVMLAACMSNKCQKMEPQCCRTATGIIEFLSDYSESACSEIVGLGGLDIILLGCKKTDGYVLQHCARAIANFSLYGDAGMYSVMSEKRVPMWLFPLAFYSDNTVKYYSLIAASAMYSRGFEAALERSHVLELVRKFVTTHSPTEFAHTDLIGTGHRAPWLKAFIPSLSSARLEIRMLASFHFCMEASIKKSQCKESIFNDIGAIESLKFLAANQDPIASGFASETLLLLGENNI